MSLSQGFPNTFTGQVTNQVTKNHENELKKIYNDINAFMAANGHAHTGNGSDGAALLGLNGGTLTGALHQPNPVSITSASGVLTLLETSNSFVANGTEAVTSIAGWSKGIAIIRWNTARTLTYNATSLILQNLTDRITSIGDIGVYEMTSAGAREIDYFPANQLNNASIQGTFKNLKITNNTVISFTGNTTNLSTSVTSVSSTAGLVVGMFVYGSGISAGTTISSIGTGTITLSTNATITASTVPLTAGYCNTRADITADQLVLFNSLNSAYLVTNVSLTASTVVSGVNGLDTGTKANSTWYSVWIIVKADGTKASLLSLSATSPTMPTDYIYKARVGWIRTDSSGNLLRLLQLGRSCKYIVTANSNTTSYPIIASGSQGNVSTPTFVAASLSSLVPTTAYKIGALIAVYASGQLVLAPNSQFGSFNSTTNPPPYIIDFSSSFDSLPTILNFEMILESNNVYYASNISSSSNAFSQLISWEDSI